MFSNANPITMSHCITSTSIKLAGNLYPNNNNHHIEWPRYRINCRDGNYIINLLFKENRIAECRVSHCMLIIALAPFSCHILDGDLINRRKFRNCNYSISFVQLRPHDPNNAVLIISKSHFEFVPVV